LKICPKCGKIPAEYEFCTKCDVKLKAKKWFETGEIRCSWIRFSPNGQMRMSPRWPGEV